MDWSTIFPALAQRQAMMGRGMPMGMIPPAAPVARPQLPPQAAAQPLPAMQPPKLPPQGMLGAAPPHGLPFAF